MSITEQHCFQKPVDTWSCFTAPPFWEARISAHFAARGTRVTADFLKVWWRAQAAAYLMRLNRQTSEALLAMRRDPGRQSVSVAGAPQPAAELPFPLPSGTVGMHIRHGDKGVEMHLIPFEAYVTAAEKLVKENPMGLKLTAFVSSEDPAVIADARALVRIDNGARPSSVLALCCAEC